MKKISLCRDKGFAIVDDEDYEALSEYSWSKHPGGHTTYANCTAFIHPGDQCPKNALMHRMIMDPPPGLTIDHINGDGLDNRRDNLRIVGDSGNHLNTRRKNRACDLPMGVRSARGGRFRAEVGYRGNKRTVGIYDTPEEACAAYRAAREELIAEEMATLAPIIQEHYRKRGYEPGSRTPVIDAKTSIREAGLYRLRTQESKEPPMRQYMFLQ